MDIPNGGLTNRYRLSIDECGDVTPESKLRMQIVDDENQEWDFVDLSKRTKYNSAVKVVRELLTAFSK